MSSSSENQTACLAARCESFPLHSSGDASRLTALRREAQRDDAVHTVGTRVDMRHGPWALDGELAGQTGSYGGLDHRAALLRLGGSYTTGLPGKLKLGTAFNLGSGDDDPTDAPAGPLRVR